MEQETKLHNAFDPLQDSNVVRDIVAAWQQATFDDGLSGMRKVDTGRTLLGVAAMAGSGFAYPGVGRGQSVILENGAQYQEDNREASFNRSSKTEQA